MIQYVTYRRKASPIGERSMFTKASPVVAAAFLLLCSGVSVAGDWRQPWASVKSDAAKKCAEIFPQYQLQPVCMENEKQGYDRMQGNFGLPPDVADKAKIRCAETFPQ